MNNKKTLALRQIVLFLLIPIFLFVSCILIFRLLPGYYMKLNKPTGSCINLPISLSDNQKLYECDLNIFKKDYYALGIIYQKNEDTNELLKFLGGFGTSGSGENPIKLDIQIIQDEKKIYSNIAISPKVVAIQSESYFSLVDSVTLTKGHYIVKIKNLNPVFDLKEIVSNFSIDYNNFGAK